MYSLVLRQLSPIQKGVQSAHSIVEYIQKFHKSTEYIQWVTVDKTIIMLDGGTYQELKECRDTLADLGVPYAAFYEKDLGNIITSISFLIEDKVWDTKSYPANEEELDEHVWLSLKNAMLICDKITESLKAIDPSNSDHYQDNANINDPSIESVGRKSSARERNRQTAATKHDHRDEVFNIAKTISHSDRQLDFVVGRFNFCVGNTMPDG